MKQSIAQHKKMLLIILAIIVVMVSFVLGGVIGIQYFYEDFVVFKTNLKADLGIVTAADMALLEEAAVQDVSIEETETVEEAIETSAISGTADDCEEPYTILINGQATVIDVTAATLTWFDAKQISTETWNSFAIGAFSEYDVYLDGQAVESGEVVYLEVETIAVNYGIELKLISKETGVVTNYYIRTLHSSYNTLSSGEGQGDGYYYFTQDNHMYKMDTQGNLVFFKTVTEQAFDFKAYMFDDEVYYVYMEESFDIQNDAIAKNSVQTKAVVMNSNYEVIDEIISLLAEDGTDAGLALDMHEFVMLGVDHYILSAYVEETVDNIPEEYSETGVQSLSTTVIQEVEDGEILFQWQSSDYTELYTLNYINQPDAEDLTRDTEYPIDYVHFNSIEVDPNDNNFILSFRRISAVIKIDRETGDIIWVLGGEGDEFGLTEEQKFSRQHFARYADDETITVFDNGTANRQTRVVSYVLDEENMTVVEYESYQIDGKYSSFMGSTMRLNDEALYLVAWGGGNVDGVIFTEIDFATGETYFELMDPSESDRSYRAYKFDY
ncbi:MAG: aryl-sulfate sulfotransferase [Faecalibacterium sp.]